MNRAIRRPVHPSRMHPAVRSSETPSGPRRRRAQQRIRPSVQRMLDAMTVVPAFVRNDRLDILAANRLGRAFYSLHFDSSYRPVNSARFAFLDTRARSCYLDWESVARELAADPGLTLFVYTAESGSKSEQALNLLASWAATPDEEVTNADREEQPRHRSRAE
jgi:MmyB-like transcription regulator ligand binding domain